MDRNLLKYIGISDSELLNQIEFIDKCIDIYNQTMQAAGITAGHTLVQSVTNTQINYTNTLEEDNYANISESYK